MNGTVRSGSRSNMWSTWYRLNISTALIMERQDRRNTADILIRDAFVVHLLVTVNKQLWNRFKSRWLVWRCAQSVYHKHENDTAYQIRPELMTTISATTW